MQGGRPVNRDECFSGGNRPSGKGIRPEAMGEGHIGLIKNGIASIPTRRHCWPHRGLCEKNLKRTYAKGDLTKTRHVPASPGIQRYDKRVNEPTRRKLWRGGKIMLIQLVRKKRYKARTDSYCGLRKSTFLG